MRIILYLLRAICKIGTTAAEMGQTSLASLYFIEMLED